MRDAVRTVTFEPAILANGIPPQGHLPEAKLSLSRVGLRGGVTVHVLMMRVRAGLPKAAWEAAGVGCL